MTSEGSQPKLFARKASGLVREFGFFDTYIFNTAGYALGLVLASTALLAGALYPGANVTTILILGVCLAAFNGLTYGLLSGAMPRSGGDYVYNGRVLHPAIGFMTNFGFTCAQILAVGIYAQWTVNYAMSVSFQVIGYGIKSQGLLDLGAYIAQPVPSLVVGILVIALIVLVHLAGMKFLRKFLNTAIIIAFVGTLVTFFVFIANTRESFIAAFNQFMSTTTGLADAYQSIIQLAVEKGFTQPPITFGAALMALPLGYWMFLGFTNSAYLGGEIKEPQKTQSYAMIGALLSGFILYIIIFLAYYNIVGLDFNNSLAYLIYFDQSPLPTDGVMNFFAGLLTNSVFLIIVMGISFFLWFFLLEFTIVTVCVRNIFSWSIDRLAPEWLTKVNSKTRAPSNATIFVGIMGIILLAGSIFTTFLSEISNFIATWAIAFWITSFSAILLPFRRKELFEASPPSVQRKVFGIPLVTIAGIFNLVLFTLVLYAAFTLPLYSGPLGPAALAFIFGVYVVGIIIYLIVAGIRKKQGVDLNLLYGEIPPE